MNVPTPSSLSSSRQICPECLTVLPDDASPCGHCGLSRGWLNRVPEFQEALRLAETAGDCQLSVRVRGPAGDTELTCSIPGELALPAPTGTIRLSIKAIGDPLQIDASTPEHPLPLPGMRMIDGVEVRARVVASPDGAKKVLPINECRREATSLTKGTPKKGNCVVSVGRGTDNYVQLLTKLESPQHDAESVDSQHCIIVREPESEPPCFWIVDLQSKTGTFVNHQPVLAQRLVAGDLVQVGPFAWMFNEADGFLIPVRGIDGVGLKLQNVSLEGRLENTTLEVRAGEFVAIVGPSGSGKSTLLKAILGAVGSRDGGTILADGNDIDTHRDWYQSVLGYVSQHAVIHSELSARQSLRFSRLLRTGELHDGDNEQILREVDLPEGCWDRPVRDLSGGEAVRVRTGAELVAEPRLLLLDEPTTGLDEEREQRVFNLLRSLSYRGCTVIVITHSNRRLDLFDRIVRVNNRRVVEVEEKRRRADSEVKESRPSNDPVAPTVPRRRQLATYMRREGRLIWNDWKWRLLLPLVIVPVFFAVALSLTVPHYRLERLGFLSVLTSIWMGSSLSLMAIVNEREVLDHERLLFLRLPSYLAAKTFVLWMASAIQTSLFVLVLWGLRCATDQQMLYSVDGTTHVRGHLDLRCATDQQMLYSPMWSGFYLGLLGCAAVGLGLLLSALAHKSQPAANFMLSLVVMVQIVFSVFVAGNGDAGLDGAYGEFHVHACRGATGCTRRVALWRPPAGDGWLCDQCHKVWPKDPNGTAEYLPDSPKTRETLNQNRAIDAKRDTNENRNRPHLWAAGISYATLSRYGDITLRSFAHEKADWKAFREPDSVAPNDPREHYPRWRREAAATLVLAMLSLPIITGGVLWFSWRREKLRQRICQSLKPLSRWRSIQKTFDSRRTRTVNNAKPIVP